VRFISIVYRKFIIRDVSLKFSFLSLDAIEIEKTRSCIIEYSP